MSGSNSEYADGSVDAEIAANVLPQKLPAAKTMPALPLGIFFTRYPHFLANFTAVSPPSTPAAKIRHVM